MLPASRDTILLLLRSFGIDLPPKIALPTELLEKRLKKALDCAQYITDVIPDATENKTLAIAGLPSWTKSSVYEAVRRGNFAEANLNNLTDALGVDRQPALFSDPLMDLRQSVMSIARSFDAGLKMSILQEEESGESMGESVIIRALEVLQLDQEIPVIMVLYLSNETPLSTDEGAKWLDHYFSLETEEDLYIAKVTSNIMEQHLLLRLLTMNSKRVPPSYVAERGPHEEEFKVSFLLPVGPLDVHDLNELNGNSGCTVCGQDGTKRCSNCLAIFYCSAKCQKYDWSGRKSTCKTLKGAKWSKMRFRFAPADMSMVTFSHQTVLSRPRLKIAENVRHASDPAPPNIHGTRPFLVKIQYNGDPELGTLIYDRQRSFEVYFPRYADEDEAAVYDALVQVIVRNERWRGVKAFFWARRVGDWELDLALDRLPDQDIKW